MTLKGFFLTLLSILLVASVGWLAFYFFRAWIIIFRKGMQLENPWSLKNYAIEEKALFKKCMKNTALGAIGIALATLGLNYHVYNFLGWGEGNKALRSEEIAIAVNPLETKEDWKRLCVDSESLILDDISDAGSCTQDSDCIHFVYQPGTREEINCHHYINQNELTKIRESIYKIKKECPEKMVLCKEPRPEFIKCIKGKCGLLGSRR